jgi:hypothetical protein
MDMRKLSRADRLRLLRDLDANSGNVHAQQIRQWIRSAHEYTAKVANEGQSASAEARAVFWIRVSAVFGEVHANQERLLAMIDESIAHAELTNDHLLHRMRTALAELVNAIDAAKASLSDDELLYLLYRRDVECHPWQDSYRLRVAKNGLTLADKRTVFGKEWTVEEMDSALGALLLKHGMNEPAIAVAFASKLNPHMQAILRASEAWFTLPPDPGESAR